MGSHEIRNAIQHIEELVDIDSEEDMELKAAFITILNAAKRYGQLMEIEESYGKETN